MRPEAEPCLVGGVWEPALYLRFERYRTRPVRDLIARLPFAHLQTIIDLGCGTGNSTALLAQRWPQARVIGVDDSATMLAAARQQHPALTWQEADVAAWRPSAPVDLVFANASLHWVSDHRTLLHGLLAFVRPQGAIAFQLPAAYDQPAAEVYHEVLASDPWRRYRTAWVPQTVEKPGFYHGVLAPFCAEVDIWETVYHHLLASHAEMVAWYRATGLRSFFSALPDDSARDAFTADLTERYRLRFPAEPDGKVLFPFHRLFVVGIR